VLKLLAGSEFVRKAQSDAAARTLTERVVRVAELSRLERDAERDFPKLRAAADAAMADFVAAEKALAPARAKHAAAAARLSTASFAFTNEHDRLEQELRATASLEISLFVTWAWTEWEANAKALSGHSAIARHVVTRERRSVGASNLKSITARRAALREAIVVAEAMLFEPDQAGVSARLEQLRQALPAIVFVDTEAPA
jgi:hypothetical protein